MDGLHTRPAMCLLKPPVPTGRFCRTPFFSHRPQGLPIDVMSPKEAFTATRQLVDKLYVGSA